MKKTISTIIFCVASLLMFFIISCNEVMPVDRKEASVSIVPRSINVSSLDINFSSPLSSSTTFRISSSNVEWEITNVPNWITVSPKTGGDGTTIVSVSVTENINITNRVGLFSLESKDESWQYSRSITVSQARAFLYAIPESTRIEFDGSASSTRVKVNSNYDDWSVSGNQSSAWCTVNKSDGEVVLSVTPNTGNTSRECQIQITTPDNNEYITVIQHPANISSTTDRIDFGVAGGTQNVQIQSDAEWTAITSYAWINVSPETGYAGDATITVQVTANNSLAVRNGYVYIVLSDDRKIEIPVYQECILFSVDKTLIESPSDGQVYQLSVLSNVAWKLLDSIPTWISVSPKTGTGNEQVSVSIDANPGYSERNAIIRIAPVSLTNAATEIKVKQDGCTFESDSTSLHLSDKASSASFSIITEGSWILSSSDPWITTDKVSGTGNTRITVSVDENTADTVRVGYVIASVEGKQIKVAVYQQGKYLNLSSNALQFTSKGGSTQISIKTNNSWTAHSSNEWIELSKTEGTDDCDITITAKDNASVNARSGYVDIQPKGFNSIRVIVNQAARYLSVSVDTLYFFYKGGTSEPVTINTDGNADVTTDDDWLTINKETDNRFTVSASNNDKESTRTASITISLNDLEEGSKYVNVVVYQLGGLHNGYEYVDLGLSVKWATCNVGSLTPEGSGNYYAWGELEPKSEYSWNTYIFGTEYALTKYCSSDDRAKDSADYKTTLESIDDVARIEWGGYWRTPTKAEFEELINNCSCTETTKNGIKGYEFRSRIVGYEDRSVFLPNIGYKTGTNTSDEDKSWYWTSAVNNQNSANAWASVNNNVNIVFNSVERYYGLPVRPVYSPTTLSDDVKIELNSNAESIEIEDIFELIATVKNGNEILDCGVIWSTGNPNIATVSKKGIITGVAAGTTTITATCFGKTANCVITVIEPAHGYVDLGLSVKWATSNIGASTSYEYGDYYAWGEILPKSDYSWPTYKWCNGSSTTLSKYNSNINNGTVDNKTALDPQDDVAHVLWGENWRLPTKEEQMELLENCTWEWTTENGVYGCRVTSKIPGYTNRYIFLPAGGFMEGTNLYNSSLGIYWSSSLDVDNTKQAWSNDSYSTPVFDISSDSRNRGFSVRPVCPSNAWIRDVSITLDRESQSVIIGDSCTLTVTVKHGNDILNREVVWTSSNPSVASVDSKGLVTGISEGSTTITVSCFGKTAVCTVTVSYPVYEYVNLGLSVNWATCNVGASKPEDFGGYYAWGETETKATYTWTNYKFRTDGNKFGSVKYSKYNSNANSGTVDNKSVLDLEDDVAHVKMGGSWRMPTDAEQDELRNNCTWTWTTLNGVDGFMVTSNITGYEDKSIFLPAAGYRDDMAYNVGIYANYWSSSLYKNNIDYARDFDVSFGYISVGTGGRYSGLPVRPVRPSKEWMSSVSITLNSESVSMGIGNTYQLSATVKHQNDILNRDVTWSSANSSIATVDENGFVTGISSGSTTITATCCEKTAVCVITVIYISSGVEVLRTNWKSEVDDSSRPIPTSLYVHSGVDTFRKGTGVSTGTKCGLYSMTGEGLYDCAFYLSSRNIGATGNAYSIVTLDDGNYTIEFRACGWSSNDRKLILKLYPKPAGELADGNANGFALLEAVSEKTIIGEIDSWNANISSSGSWPVGASDVHFDFTIPTTGNYVLEFYTEGSSDYKGVIFSNYSIKRNGNP